MIREFQPGMELPAFADDACPAFEESLRFHDIGATITVVDLDDPFNQTVFTIWEDSAQRADEAGTTRRAVVTDGIKSLSLRGKIDTDELAVFTSEDRTEAIEWARSG